MDFGVAVARGEPVGPARHRGAGERLAVCLAPGAAPGAPLHLGRDPQRRRTGAQLEEQAQGQPPDHVAGALAVLAGRRFEEAGLEEEPGPQRADGRRKRRVAGGRARGGRGCGPARGIGQVDPVGEPSLPPERHPPVEGVGTGPLGGAGGSVEPDTPDVDAEPVEPLQHRRGERRGAEESVVVAEGEQVEELGPVEIAARRELEPLLAREPGEHLLEGGLGDGQELVGLDHVLPGRGEPERGAGRGTGLRCGLAGSGGRVRPLDDGAPELPAPIPVPLVQEGERRVGEPHGAVGTVSPRRRIGGTPGLLGRRGRRLGGEAGDARGQVPLPLLAEHGHRVAVRGEAVGIEDGREPGLGGEAGHVPEPFLGERPGKGVDDLADLLDLLGVHGPWPQGLVAGRGAAAEYWSITSSSVLRHAGQKGTSFRENMMQSMPER